MTTRHFFRSRALAEIGPTSDQIRTLRSNDASIGVLEAKDILTRQNMRKAIEEAKTVEDLKPLLRVLVEMTQL